MQLIFLDLIIIVIVIIIIINVHVLVVIVIVFVVLVINVVINFVVIIIVVTFPIRFSRISSRNQSNDIRVATASFFCQPPPLSLTSSAIGDVKIDNLNIKTKTGTKIYLKTA